MSDVVLYTGNIQSFPSNMQKVICAFKGNLSGKTSVHQVKTVLSSLRNLSFLKLFKYFIAYPHKMRSLDWSLDLILNINAKRITLLGIYETKIFCGITAVIALGILLKEHT